jgi:hypothetical protein
LLAVLVPMISAFAVWPTRFTAVLATVAILAWMVAGNLIILRDAP